MHSFPPHPLHRLRFANFHPQLFIQRHVVEEHYEAVEVDVDVADQDKQHHRDGQKYFRLIKEDTRRYVPTPTQILDIIIKKFW